MLVVFAFALLILAAAVVVLFAMLAELATRVPERSARPERDPKVRTLDSALIGHEADTWPAVLPGPDRGVLLVLSTTCVACDDVAKQLVSDPGHTDWDGMGIVISSAGREKGEDFVARQGLGGFPVYVDEGGEWVAGQFEVRTSPSALVFNGGRLASAHTFNDVGSLRMVLDAPSGNETAPQHNGHKQKEAV